jgi:hypothetical protein
MQGQWQSLLVSDLGVVTILRFLCGPVISGKLSVSVRFWRVVLRKYCVCQYPINTTLHRNWWYYCNRNWEPLSVSGHVSHRFFSFPTSANRLTLAVCLKVQPRMREMDFSSTWTKQQIILYSLNKDPAANSIKTHINAEGIILNLKTLGNNRLSRHSRHILLEGE